MRRNPLAWRPAAALLVVTMMLLCAGARAADGASSSSGDPSRVTELEALVRELRQHVADLQQRVQDLEQPAIPPSPEAHPARKEATHTTPSGFWRLPGTNIAFKLGGYVKVDAIYDFNNIGNQFKFATQTIAVPDDRESRTTINAQVAAELSSYDITPTGAFMGSATTPAPDLTGNLRVDYPSGHLQLSGVLRYLSFEGSAGSPDDSAWGWGTALSGLAELGSPGRRLMGQVSYGEGSARYNQALRGTGSDAVLKPNGELETLPLFTLVAGYEHDWAEQWTSTFAYSNAYVDTIAAQGGTAIEWTRSLSANLVWHPFSNFLTGIEYLYGTRENRNGQDGSAHRLQSSFKFSF